MKARTTKTFIAGLLAYAALVAANAAIAALPFELGFSMSLGSLEERKAG